MNHQWDKSIRRAELGIAAVIVAGVVAVMAIAIVLDAPTPPTPRMAERPTQPICKVSAAQGRYLTCDP